MYNSVDRKKPKEQPTPRKDNQLREKNTTCHGLHDRTLRCLQVLSSSRLLRNLVILANLRCFCGDRKTATTKKSKTATTKKSSSGSSRKSSSGSMVPPTSNKKRPSSVAFAGKGGAKKPAAKAATTAKAATNKRSNTKSQSTLSFATTKHPLYQLGTKILLDDCIYETEVPLEVKGHLFVYEVVAFSENGKTVKVEYKNQVIHSGGDKFRVYKDSDDSTVCFFAV